MKNNTELNRQRWREALFQTFASEGNSKDNCRELGDRFDKLTDGGMSGEGAAGIIYSAYGANDAKKICRTISEWVNSELEEFNKNHIGVNTSSKARLKKAVEVLAANIDKVSIVFNGQELTAQEIERIKPKLPIYARTLTVHQASASSKAGLSIEIII